MCVCPCNDPNVKFADTIVGKWNGNIDKILEYYPKKNKYKVRFIVPGQKPYIDVIPVSYLRGPIPTKMSELEKEFFGIWEDMMMILKKLSLKWTKWNRLIKVFYFFHHQIYNKDITTYIHYF